MWVIELPFMTMRTAFAWIFTLLSASTLYGQRYNFKFYGEEEGLQNLAVQVVFQDRAGFLWVGTQNGLYRYDGNRFAGFGKTDGLPDAHIESLHESIDGTLWVGTRFGLARWTRDHFEKVPIGEPARKQGVKGCSRDDAELTELGDGLRQAPIGDAHAHTALDDFWKLDHL